MAGELVTAAPSVDECARQASVDALSINRAPNLELQKIVEEAARIADTPIAAITLIDHGRQRFIAKIGLELDETPRAISLCAHAIHRPGEPMVIPDARLDQRFARDGLVARSPFIRFYAGIPLVNRSGYALGALCVIDTKPRRTTPNLFELASLARQAERILCR